MPRHIAGTLVRRSAGLDSYVKDMLAFWLGVKDSLFDCPGSRIHSSNDLFSRIDYSADSSYEDYF